MAHTPLTQGSLESEYKESMEQVPVPLGRWAQPEEIADAARWMLAPTTSYLVGSYLVIDGGTDALLRPDTF